MKRNLIIAIILFSSFIVGQNKITVGTKVAEPFVIKHDDGSWGGVSFDLWKDITQNLDIQYDVSEFDLSGLTTAVENSEIDIAVSPLSITTDREQVFDFTHPYFITGLSIAVPAKEESGLFSLAKRIISPDFFEAIGFLAFILFLVGFITWLFERKKNPEEFGDGKSKGLWSSFWFAAVTMTTVGYGDKSPKSVGGRIVALIWMFAAIIIISSITAAIASALTVGQLETNVRSLNDLYNADVGTIGASSAESYLMEKRINYSSSKTVSAGLQSVADGSLEAFVYDAPIMKYLIKKEGLSSKVKVLPVTLEQVYYGFALPTNSPLREKLNRAIIEKISDPKWEDVLYKYFGE